MKHLSLIITTCLVAIALLTAIAIPAWADDNGTITPADPGTVDNRVDNATTITNDAGTIYYIVSGGGDVMISAGPPEPEPGTGDPEYGMDIPLQVAYGVTSDMWINGVAILNPHDTDGYGTLKIDNQYMDVFVHANRPLLIRVKDRTAPDVTSHVISLESESLTLYSGIWKNF